MAETIRVAAEEMHYHDAQRLAWGVLLLAFAGFCLLAAASILGINYFLFNSTISMQSVMRVGRGTVGVSEAGTVEEAERNRRSLVSNQVVRTDPQSQATISFRDPRGDGQLVAAATLHSDTTLALRAASRPRFEWGATPYDVSLDDLSGTLDIFVPNDLPHNFQIRIQTPQDVLINLRESGQYTISASESQVQVITRAGQALLFPPNPEFGNAISAGEQGALLLDQDATEITVTAASINLLDNSTFQQTHITTSANGTAVGQVLPINWGCANNSVDLPLGSYSIDNLDGRSGLLLSRSRDASSHGETICTQGLDPQQGLDVSGFSNLSLRATLFVDSQSLSACGIEASECPLILRIDYVDINGIPRQWFHGFYSVIDPQLDYPLRCNSCFQDHEFINPQAWYTYDSGNLFTQLAQLQPDQRPSSILNVRFYASGHQYEVFVSELALLAG